MTAPGLAWQAFLKTNGCELELMSDINMHPFIEKGIRGCVSVFSNRHTKASNRYIKDFNPDKNEKYIIYLDANNNHYGWAMAQPLPYVELTWMDAEDITEETILNTSDDAELGYI